ncbi:hypothetical protein [Methylomicrobium sp. Wu6]|uniref:hypothetical protein n=1 Tax=Methylomicrobium sp. Wu6 TaxID=3107928 RepID=UPI002DD637B2|nr:hypothetical protein [Methylomicrobium sp. Wu6]MEC4749733.1 hypothetical protein [Methylomicrobium sp. Wu6]
MNHNVANLDIAKNIFSSVHVERGGKVRQTEAEKSGVIGFFANYPANTIGIEACGGAHHWAR